MKGRTTSRQETDPIDFPILPEDRNRTQFISVINNLCRERNFVENRNQDSQIFLKYKNPIQDFVAQQCMEGTTSCGESKLMKDSPSFQKYKNLIQSKAAGKYEEPRANCQHGLFYVLSRKKVHALV